MVAVTDDGTRYMAVPDGHGRWLMAPITLGAADTPPPPADGGGTGGSGTGATAGLNAVPASLASHTAAGVPYTLTTVQLTHARDILKACQEYPKANDTRIMRICLITVLVEGNCYMYSNVRHYPETVNYPHDRDGSDSDSVGLYQQRPAAGWGTPKQCMDVTYSTHAFLGDYGPRGLLDISWQSKTPGQAAQAVQVSAFPTRYDNMVPVADAIIKALVK